MDRGIAVYQPPSVLGNINNRKCHDKFQSEREREKQQ